MRKNNRRCLFAVRPLVLVLVLSGPLSPAAAANAPKSRTFVATAKPLQALSTPARVADIAFEGGELFVSDVEKHRILVLGATGVRRSLGGIGNAPGELYYPREVAVSSQGFVVVNDTGNHRIQVLGLEGSFKAEIRQSETTWGLAAAGERIYVGFPSRDYLVEVHREDGTLVGNLGVPLGVDEFYPESATDGEKRAWFRALNRVQIAVDHEGNVWLAFLHSPLVQKYSPSGKLLLEKEVSILTPDNAGGAARDLGAQSGRKGSSINIDGVQLEVVFREIAFDPRSKTLLLLTGDSRIITLDVDAEVTRGVMSFEGLDSGAGGVAPGLKRANSIILSSYAGNSPLFVAQWEDVP